MPDFSTIADIAVAIVGFSGIVLALNNSNYESDNAGQARLADLLIAGFGVVFLALLPDFLVTFLDPMTVWRVASGIFAAWFSYGIVSFWIRLKGNFFKAPANAVASIIGIGLTIGLFGICFGLWTESAHTIYLAALLWGLFISAMEFTLLLLSLKENAS